VLVAVIRPENQVSVTFSQLGLAEALVPQCEAFSPANQDFLMELRTRCDSVLRSYLSKIAENTEKRNYLHVLYTTAITLRLPPMQPRSLEAFLNDVTQILDLYPPTFERCSSPHVLLDAAWQWDIQTEAYYLRDFLWKPERSGSFRYDQGLWSAVVAARYMKYLRITSNLRCDI